MSSRSRKQSRTTTEENRADCPFVVSMIATPSFEEQRDPTPKKRKRDSDKDGAIAPVHPVKKEWVQISPFEPRGKFKSHQSMNLAYTIEPRKRWSDMTRYNSFVLNGDKYCNDDFVYVANDMTIERQKKATGTDKNADGANLLQSLDYWVARILEVRASDEHHVYARVYWMYSPDELPPGTRDGKKYISGRQPYHGQNELIASNHMDVINVVSVAMKATVHQCIESDDDEIQDALYWRQAFNCRTSQLSSVEPTCKCQTPANPDKTLIGCTNSDCGKWLHYDCLLHDILTQVYEQLGTDKPHKSQEKEKETTPVKQETDTGRSLTLTGIEEAEQRPTAIKVKEVKETGENGDSSPMSRRVKSAMRATTQTPTPTPGPPNSAGQRSAKSASAKRNRGKKADEKPYEGHFEASLRTAAGPMVWEITDLRPDVEGGDRSWTERAACLVCRKLIS